MNDPKRAQWTADEGRLEAPVGRPEPERASDCGLTECRGKPECRTCAAMRILDQGFPPSAAERYLRRLLAVRVAIPGTYYDDGEAQGCECGISIDFMREPVADIDAKLRALNVARYEMRRRGMPDGCATPDGCAAHGCRGECLPPNVELTGLRPHRSNE